MTPPFATDIRVFLYEKRRRVERVAKVHRKVATMDDTFYSLGVDHKKTVTRCA